VREGDPGRSDRPIYVSVDNQRKRSTRGVDGAIFELARRQHGVFGRGQLIALGLSESNIEYRLLAGRLQILYRGVYGLGSPGSKLARWMAAVLAAGPGAVLSHRSAAELWGLLDGFTRPIHVTVPSARRGRPGIRFHRSILPDDERTVFEGIPVTTVPRTFVDCAPGMSARRLERMINEADVLRLYDHLSVPDLLHRYPGRSGSRALWKALHKRNAGTTITRTELEELFLELVDEIGLPRPEINASFELDGEPIEIDALWRAERVAVELDSRQFHDTPLAFERDRRRDRKLMAARWRPIRITWRQLTEEPTAVAADLTAMLSQAEAA
jgi:Transcriptional regulator, AbiEi antitoxin